MGEVWTRLDQSERRYAPEKDFSFNTVLTFTLDLEIWFKVTAQPLLKSSVYLKYEPKWALWRADTVIVKQENLGHMYFSANTSAYTLAQINFSAQTYFKRKNVLFEQRLDLILCSLKHVNTLPLISNSRPQVILQNVDRDKLLLSQFKSQGQHCSIYLHKPT